MATKSAPLHKLIKRVLVFGETGTGKTSMLNILASGKEYHATSGNIIGCTFRNEPYKPIFLFDENVDRVQYLFVDTAGLNEGNGGRLKSFEAMQAISNFLAQNRRGFHLLILVTKPKLTESLQRNHDLFVNVLFENKIPCIIVVSNMETHRITNWDRWIRDNTIHFKNYGIRQPGGPMDERYVIPSVWLEPDQDGTYGIYDKQRIEEMINRSKSQLSEAIKNLSLAEPVSTIVVRSNYYTIFVKIWNILSSQKNQYKIVPQSIDEFKKYITKAGNLTADQAQQLADNYVNGFEKGVDTTEIVGEN